MFPVTDVIPSRTTPYVTIGLILVNAAIFLAALLLGDRLTPFLRTFGLVPAFFSWWTLITSMFLHAGWVPVLGNMLYLWIFADNVEDRLGHARFIALFVGCGTAAALGHVAFDPHSTTPMMGASGAVSGVMGAYFALYPQSRVLTAVFLFVTVDLVEVPAVFYLGVWFLLQLFSGAAALDGRTAVGAAASAHVAAFVTGGLIGLACRFGGQTSRSYWRYDAS